MTLSTLLRNRTHPDRRNGGFAPFRTYVCSSLRRRLVDALGGAAPEGARLGRRAVAKIIAVIIIITTGLTLAFGDSSGGFRKLIQIIFGLSIAFAASSFFLSFFSFGGGALIS